MNVPIGFVPSAINVGQASGPNGVMVMLTVSDPTGSHTWFIPPANAKALGENLVKAGEAGNIVIAQPGALPDLGKFKAATSEPDGPGRAEKRAACREAERAEKEARAQSAREALRAS